MSSKFVLASFFVVLLLAIVEIDAGFYKHFTQTHPYHYQRQHKQFRSGSRYISRHQKVQDAMPMGEVKRRLFPKRLKTPGEGVVSVDPSSLTAINDYSKLAEIRQRQQKEKMDAYKFLNWNNIPVGIFIE